MLRHRPFSSDEAPAEQFHKFKRDWGLHECTGWPEFGDTPPEVTYLTNQLAADRVDYAAARRAGQAVGSGPVEATCENLVGVRFKRPGARWKPASGGRVLRLRAVVLTGRWNATMDLLHAHARAQHEIKRGA